MRDRHSAPTQSTVRYLPVWMYCDPIDRLYTDPAHAAYASNEPAFRHPRRCWSMFAVVGKAMSPVVVPTTMKSISPGSTPARSIACWAARSARSDVASSSATTWRSRMPVRCTIHSSDVATSFSRSALVSTRVGT